MLFDQTLAVWQPRTKRKLNHEDAREIVVNVSGFFQVLREWDAKDQVASAAVIADRQRESSTAKVPPLAAGE